MTARSRQVPSEAARAVVTAAGRYLRWQLRSTESQLARDSWKSPTECVWKQGGTDKMKRQGPTRTSDGDARQEVGTAVKGRQRMRVVRNRMWNGKPDQQGKLAPSSPTG